MTAPAESLFAPIRALADRAGFTGFLRWWWGELLAMVPPSWRENFAARGVAYIAVEGDEWRVLRPVQGSLTEVGRANLGAQDLTRRRAEFRRLVERAVGGGAANVWLVLEPDAVLLRSVTLPLAAEEALREALGFELDRLTPFAPEKALYDHRVAGRDVAAQRLSIDLAVAARLPVAARLAELRELGATVLGVGVATDLERSSAPFNLLATQDKERPATSRAARAARVLATVAGLLAVAALVYPLWQQREAFIALQPRLERAKAGADVAERLAREIEKLAAEHNFLLEKKQRQYPAVVLVEELSKILPDTTWIQQLDIKSGPKLRELQIAGETGSSSQLIEVLEKSGSLSNASFKSPLTKGVTPNTERFLVSAEVKARPLPKPIPEAELMAASAARTHALPPAPAVAGSAAAQRPMEDRALPASTAQPANTMPAASLAPAAVLPPAKAAAPAVPAKPAAPAVPAKPDAPAVPANPAARS